MFYYHNRIVCIYLYSIVVIYPIRTKLRSVENNVSKMCKEKINKIKNLFKYLIVWIEQVRPIHLVYSVFKLSLINIILVTYYCPSKRKFRLHYATRKIFANAILLI